MLGFTSVLLCMNPPNTASQKLRYTTELLMRILQMRSTIGQGSKGSPASFLFLAKRYINFLNSSTKEATRSGSRKAP